MSRDKEELVEIRRGERRNVRKRSRAAGIKAPAMDRGRIEITSARI
jgi:hypothetical protein